MHSFPNIRIGLMVGIGGGAPSPKHDIRLGDVVVSIPRNGQGGVLQYDFQKTTQEQSLQFTGFLDQPPTILRAAASGLQALYETEGHQLEDAIDKVLENEPRLRKHYKRLDQGRDRLYRNEIVHPPDSTSSCDMVCGNDISSLVLRSPRTEDDDDPAIHYGLIASANQLMKDALIRDRLASEKTFSAYAKDLLHRIPPQQVEAEWRIIDSLKPLVDHVVQTADRIDQTLNLERLPIVPEAEFDSYLD
ncbi:hypothetical protein BDW74DRAFT_174458 [Aspergillus multicolor]|uniref:uncharacterized protein n=1 Tax=Aspergillus multicolor TaxID=41759 RepID=UPI003CCD1F73